MLKRKLVSQYQDSPKIVDVAVGTSKQTLSNRLKSKLNVYLENSEIPPKNSPGNIDGIEIEYLESQPSKQLSGGDGGASCNNGYFDPLPGGVSIYDYTDGEPYGTTSCRVEKAGTEYILTAGHNFEEDCSTLYDEAYHGSQRIGTVQEQGSPGLDWCTIETDPNSDVAGFDNTVRDADGSIYGKVIGHATQSGLLDLKSTQSVIHKQGATTCHTTGHITAVDKSDSYCGQWHNDGYVETSIPADGGDPGGPVYWAMSDSDCQYAKVVMIGIVKSADVGGNALTATQAYQIADDGSLTFGEDYCMS